MEGSLLGAVGATSLLFPVDSAWDGGKAAPGNHRLDLRGGVTMLEWQEEEEGKNMQVVAERNRCGDQWKENRSINAFLCSTFLKARVKSGFPE